MIDDLRVDLAGAVAVVEAAASFDWTWDVSDIERFCDHMGWDEPTPSRHDDTLMWARSDLDAEDAVATFRVRGHRLDTVTLPVGDEGCGLGESGATAFDEVTAALRDAFGDPTGERISARHGPSWTFAELVVGVTHGAAVELMLVDPLDQDHWGKGDRWTGDDTTVRVSHDRGWNRRVLLKVTVSPTEPSQNFLADRAANWLDYTDDMDPDPPEFWHLRPDMDRPLRPHIEFLTEPAWFAERWEELGDNVRILFNSFIDGLRFHDEYVGEIGWAIGAYDELVVHGWFGAYACEVHTVEDGEVRTRTRLLERDTATLMTETTMAALQASGAISPRDLWCEAWIPGQPAKLVAVRFGLDGDRPAPIERELDS